MYKVFIKNIDGFEKLFANDEERLKLAEPLYLLKDIDTFNEHKRKGSWLFNNLMLILNKASVLKNETKYHFLGMFLNELHLQYFDFTTIQKPISIKKEILDSQFDLLFQFMFPAYYEK